MSRELNDTIVIGNTEGLEIPSSYRVVQSLEYPVWGTSLEKLHDMELKADESNIYRILLIKPAMDLLTALVERRVRTSHAQFYFWWPQIGDPIRPAIPWRRKLARVFVNSPLLVSEEDGTTIFSSKPRAFQGRLTPALIDLEKVTSGWSYTSHTGGWVNPEAICDDLEYWDKAMNWNEAWGLETSQAVID